MKTKDKDLTLIHQYFEAETTEEQTKYVEQQAEISDEFRKKMEAYRIKFVAKKEIDALLFLASPPRPSWWAGKAVFAILLLGVFAGSYFVYNAWFDTAKNSPEKTTQVKAKVAEDDRAKQPTDTTNNTAETGRQASPTKEAQAHETLAQCLEEKRLAIVAFYQDRDSLPTLTKLVEAMQDEFDKKDMLGIIEKMKAQTEIMTTLTEKINATTLKEFSQHTQKLYNILQKIDKQYYGSTRSSPENNNAYTISPSEQEASLQQACQNLPTLINKLKEQKQLWWKTILRKLKNG